MFRDRRTELRPICKNGTSLWPEPSIFGLICRHFRAFSRTKTIKSGQFHPAAHSMGPLKQRAELRKNREQAEVAGLGRIWINVTDSPGGYSSSRAFTVWRCCC